jgi:hypothetical protein
VRGTIRSATFRRTLAAAPRAALELELVSANKLSNDAEARLNMWISAHVELAVHPVLDRDGLRDLEREVLRSLEPPLNVDGMPATPLRARLRALRERLSLGPDPR